jgi:sigma-E factor negative regulatory protein RseA
MSEHKPAQPLAESLSALVDNQASELELMRILKASEQDPELKSAWGRYQLVGSVLRGELRGEQISAVPTDFAARLSAAIDNEEVHNQLTQPESVAADLRKTRQGWLYNLGRVALVASVAGGMILGVNQFSAGSRQGAEFAVAPQTAPAPVDSSVSLPSGLTSPINTRTVALQSGYETRPQENRRVVFQPRQPVSAATLVSDEEVTRYVNQMIQAHSDNAAMNAGQGVLPYARVIMTDEE